MSKSTNRDELTGDSEDEKKLDLQKEGRLPSSAQRSKIAILFRGALSSLWRLLMLPEGLFALTFLSLFVFNSSLFVNHHFEAGNLSLQTNASLVANWGIGLIHRCTQVPVTSATETCPAVPPLLSANSDVLNRLGSDEYSNIVVNLCSSSGLQEKDLLERSQADYFEGCDSVIVKGKLRVNISFWESIGASQFILNLIRDGYKIPFYYTPTSVHFQNNKSVLHNSEFVASLHRWLLIPYRFLFSPTGRKGLS